MPLPSDRLVVFQAVAETGSFSSAARKLHRTQPAVSQAIRQLEEEVGLPLFIRTSRSVRLTEAGEMLLEYAERALETLMVAQMRLDGLTGLQGGRLTLSASDTTTCYVLPPVLSVFRRRHPAVEVQILNRPSPEVVSQVAEWEADLGIVTLPVEHPNLQVETLAAREDVAICSPGHPLGKRKRVPFAVLLDYPLLLLDKGSNTRTFIEQQIAASGKPPRIGMELGSIEVIKRLVQLDFGVSIVPHISVREEEEGERLRVIRVFRRNQSRSLGVVYPSRGVLSPAAAVFLDLLRDHLDSTRQL